MSATTNIALPLALVLAIAMTVPSIAGASITAPALIGSWSTPAGDIVAFGSCAEQMRVGAKKYDPTA